MKLTYANVTSTIALFAALTTGTTYAAQTLARDSVRSPQIRNGSVLLADLHPSVRSKLGVKAPQTATGGVLTGNLLARNVWADTGALKPGAWTEAPQSGGVVNLASSVGTSGNVELRFIGSITKPEGNGARATLYSRDASGNVRAGLGTSTGMGGGTFTADTMNVTTTDGLALSSRTLVVPATNAQSIEVRYEGKDARSTLRVQVRRL